MDEQGFKAWLGPILVQVLTGIGKYFVPALATLIGVEEAKVGNWWTSTVSLLAGLLIALACSWLTRKKILDTAAKATDDKIAENDKP